MGHVLEKHEFESISKKKQLGQRGGKVMVPSELEMMIYTADNQHFEPKRLVVYRCFSFFFKGGMFWFQPLVFGGGEFNMFHFVG